MASYLPYQHPLVPRQTLTSSSEDENVAIISSASSRGSAAQSSDFSALDAASSPLAPEREWVVFSPNIEQESNFSGELSSESSVSLSGAATPLAFPTHDGVGSFSSDEVADRVNAWRMDQSQLIIQELLRLDNERNARLNANSPLLHNLSSINMTNVYSPLEEQSVNTLSPAPSIMESWGIDEAMFATAADKFGPDSREGVLSLIHRKVTDMIGIDDKVMQLILGEAVIDPEDTKLKQRSYPHYDQAKTAGPAGWEESIITRVFNGLNIARAKDLPLFRYLGSFIERYWDWEEGVPNMNKLNYWDAERRMSDAGSVSSIAITPVW
uniref:ARAD1C03432p n=1 Tax=Blastobotrys adeninivorans TaxID=409370 RepID=A0A060SYT2_BLAAD